MNQIYLNGEPVTPEQYIKAIQDPSVVVIVEGNLRFRTFTIEQVFSNPAIKNLIRMNGGDPDTIVGNAEVIVEEEEEILIPDPVEEEILVEEPKSFSVSLNDGVGTQDSTGDTPEVIAPVGEGE